MEWFMEMDYWTWWVLAIALVVLEIFAPGVVFLWIGVAAAIVGVALFAMPELDWQAQILMFAVLSIVATVLGRMLVVRNQTETDQPSLNRRAEQYIGQEFSLDEAVVNGEGKIKVGDTFWKVRCSDCDIKSTVRVVGADGVVLIVEKV